MPDDGRGLTPAKTVGDAAHNNTQSVRECKDMTGTNGTGMHSNRIADDIKLNIPKGKVVKQKAPAEPKAKAAKPSPKARMTSEAKQRTLIVSCIAGIGCLVGLILSGIDSTMALQQFIKLPLGRAAMLAIVIDGLLIVAEIGPLFSPCPKVHRYATIYIGMAGAVSIGLNAAEFASHATSGGIYPWLNGILGGLIPLLVLISSKFAANLYLSSK